MSTRNNKKVNPSSAETPKPSNSIASKALAAEVPEPSVTLSQLRLLTANTPFSQLLEKLAGSDDSWSIREDGQMSCSLTLALALTIGAGGMACVLANGWIEEAMTGQHTQDSLDRELAICSALAPNQWGLVNAGALHRALKVHQPFSSWIAKEIPKIKMGVGHGYALHWTDLESGTFEYVLTRSKAMEIAMTQRSGRGEKIRSYFMFCENAVGVLQRQNWQLKFEALTAASTQKG